MRPAAVVARRTWLPWLTFAALMAIAIGGAVWSACFADARVARLQAYAEMVCDGDEVVWGESRVVARRMTPRGTHGYPWWSVHREWDTAAAAERALKTHLRQLRTIWPPRGLGEVHGAALDALQGTLEELEALVEAGERNELAWEQWTARSDSYPVRIYKLPGFPVQIDTIEGGGLPATRATYSAFRDLPDDVWDVLGAHGCPDRRPLIE